MRYEDWDVLLFPKDSKVPMKEFKTGCHVVHDTEFAYTHGSYGLPTMTCFTPGLKSGEQFNISLHCWNTPQISQFTKNFSSHVELVKLEVRVLIDGRLVSSFYKTKYIKTPDNKTEFTKNGELEPLRFPSFRNELLSQSYWSPADETGRIKIIISECFPRDSLTVPTERVKNVVAFSFQHAPIDILESSGIAWPNPAMWRRGPFNPTMPMPAQRHDDGADAHLHSPRHRISMNKSTSTSSDSRFGFVPTQSSGFLGSMPNTQAFLQRGTVEGSGSASTNYMDPFNHPVSESSYTCWNNNNLGQVGYAQTADMSKASYHSSSGSKVSRQNRKQSVSDTNMQGYTHASGMSNVANYSHMTELQDLNPSFAYNHNATDDPDTSTAALKVPTNTPTRPSGTTFVEHLIGGCSTTQVEHRSPTDDLDHRSSSSDANAYLNALQVNAGQRCRQRIRDADITSHQVDIDTPVPSGHMNHGNYRQIFGQQSTSSGSGSSGNFSSDLATTLTRSLLNQPLPIPATGGSMPTPNLHSLPACEIRSRKENRFGEFGEYSSQQHTPSGHEHLDHIDMRKVSVPQAAFARHHGSNTGNLSFSQSLVPPQNHSQDMEYGSRETSTTTSPPPSSHAFSGVFSHRSGSTGDMPTSMPATGASFGNSLTNLNFVHASTQQTPAHIDVCTPGGENRFPSQGSIGSAGAGISGVGGMGSGSMGPGSEKGPKRTRHFTPASQKAIDDEDEPKRGSPLTRLGAVGERVGFGEGGGALGC